LKAILEVLQKRPFYGYRKVAVALADMNVTRKQVRLIMKKAGLRAIYPGKRTTIAAKYHKSTPIFSVVRVFIFQIRYGRLISPILNLQEGMYI